MKRIKIDKLGRVVIPITIRRSLKLYEGSLLEIHLEKDRIILNRPTSLCKICYKDIDNQSGICICTSCINKIKKI